MEIQVRARPVARRVRLSCFGLALLAGCMVLPGRSVPPAPIQDEAPVPPVPAPETPEPAPPPEVRREFRGVWVASVSNMDWPSRRGLSVERQQAELLSILDRAAAIGLNAVIFQVRPAADALYASPYEPWSEYLTGTMGKAPDPYYDPLEFAVREAHRRGLELHAWFNPYRARHPSARSPAAVEHVTRSVPSLVRRYGTHLWLDPGEAATQDHTVRVVLDVVRRYDVDGIHLDDYFYPYREYDSGGKLIPFPDDASYARYRGEGGRLPRNDWRRENVNRLIERLYTEVKREKAAVKFGISPFGIWRPGYPAGVWGLNAYEEIFADARKWLASGWLDYFTPQLYWKIGQSGQSFPVLLDWWVEQNHAGRHIWPGSYSGKVKSGQRGWPATEILAQIEATRSREGASGNVHFSMTSLMESPDSLAERLASQAYAEPALVPAVPWLDRSVPTQPALFATRTRPNETVFTVVPGDAREVFLWTVQSRVGERWSTAIEPGWKRELAVAGAPDEVVVTAVGRTGNRSAFRRVVLDGE